MGKLALCSKSQVKHIRPVGVRCPTFKAMATQAEGANNVSSEERPGPLTSNGLESDSSVNLLESNAHNSKSTISNADILEQLKQISGRITVIESVQERSRTDSITSTPRRRRKNKRGTTSCSQPLDSQASLKLSDITHVSVVANQQGQTGANAQNATPQVNMTPQVTSATVTLAKTTSTVASAQTPVMMTSSSNGSGNRYDVANTGVTSIPRQQTDRQTNNFFIILTLCLLQFTYN